jgi:ADP-heptose:LPS heptosyltransferase
VASVGKFDGPKGCNLDLCKSTTIHQMAALIEYCGLFIGIDSFPLHVACATGSTAIGLFGVTLPEKVLSDASNVWPVVADVSHPFTGARHRIVTDDSVVCESNPMETITPEQVIETINRCVFRI